MVGKHFKTVIIAENDRLLGKHKDDTWKGIPILA